MTTSRKVKPASSTEIMSVPHTDFVALYCRLSPRPDGSYEGVDVQERAGRKYAAKLWPGIPIRVYADAGISAANGDDRPAYNRLREAIERGEVAHLWCVEQSRLERREVGWFELAAMLDAAGILEVHTSRDGIVRVRDEVAGIKAVLAASEVRKLTARINARLDSNAELGQPAGSRPFGYRHGVNDQGVKTLLVVEDQAEALRQSAERVLAGWSLSHVAAELVAQGLTGAHGGTITAQSVRSMLTAPTIAGLRVHRGEIIGRGNWEPILSEEVWQQCCAKLSGARTVERSDGGTYPVGTQRKPPGRKYLLTGGLAICGVCGAPLLGALKQRRQDSTPYLLCHPTKGGKACVGVVLKPVEQFVVDSLFTELDKPEFLDLIAEDNHQAIRDEIAAKLQAIEARRIDYARMDLSAAEWQAKRETLAEQEQQLHAELAEVPPPLVNVDIRTARSAWPAMTLDERREFVRLFISVVRIRRARPGTAGFDAGRVSIEWVER
jgi:site-specific DNA recombinase